MLHIINNQSVLKLLDFFLSICPIRLYHKLMTKRIRFISLGRPRLHFYFDLSADDEPCRERLYPLLTRESRPCITSLLLFRVPVARPLAINLGSVACSAADLSRLFRQLLMAGSRRAYRVRAREGMVCPLRSIA